ncbi:probable glucuronosyltransferase Os05g0123100 [Ananas comosus]|uniref:Glycosyltransferases n=1 Tax=Ananas comosus TaxID=4615 RepID=A0A6P5G1U5_ANACO|nr:probable glucuronosyltransferase Os05g0123100 [Ananas comosus]
MNSPDRAKKKSPAPAIAVAASSNLWKKALLHFSLCFATGFFSGLAPFSSSSSSQSLLRYLAHNSTHNSPQFPQSPIQTPKFPQHDRTLTEEANAYVDADPPKPLSPPTPPRPLLIIVTAASASASAVRSAAALTRLGHTLRLVPPPLLWIVAGPRDGAAAAAAAVRRMGVMQRHVAVEAGEGGKGSAAERERAAAVAHVGRHRLDGVVHFADPANVYDLRFFDELRRIQVFGTWPAAMVAGSRRRVVVEGPICRSSEVVGWFSKDVSSGMTNITKGSKPLKINISDFAFNSSILWDQERWGRPNSQPDVLQDSIMSVQKMITEDDVKLKGIPLGCSQIMLWNLNIPRTQIRNRSKG